MYGMHPIRILPLALALIALPVPVCLAQTPPAADSTRASGYPATPSKVKEVMDLTDGKHFAEAESLGWALVQDYEVNKGPESYEVARALEAYLESIARQRKVDDRAIGLADRAIRITRGAFGPEHPEVARALGVKSSLLSHSGDLEGAIELRQQELALLRKDPGPDKGILASAASNAAVYYAMLARYEEATPYFLEALDAYRDAYGEEYLDTAGAIYNLGNLYNIRGEDDEAQKYYLEALGIYEKIVEADHPRIQMTLTALGDIESRRGDYMAAREYHRRCLELAEQREGPESLGLILESAVSGTWKPTSETANGPWSCTCEHCASRRRIGAPETTISGLNSSTSGTTTGPWGGTRKPGLPGPGGRGGERPGTGS